MQALNRLVIPLLLLFGAMPAQGAHVLGGEITHKHEGSNKYSFRLVMYRNCAECAFNTNNCSDVPDLEIIGAPGTIRAGQRLATISVSRSSVKDITPMCSGAQSRCESSDGFSAGIEAWTYTGTYDFTTLLATQCAFDVSIRVESRGDVWGGSEYFYNFTRVNLCNSVRNTSPTLETRLPLFILAQGEPMRYNPIAVDPDGDSLSYRLVTALKGFERDLTYPSSLSPQQPITSYCSTPPSCTVNPNSNPPIGVYMDSLTGDLVFTPVSSGEKGFLVIEVLEWRSVSGVMRCVGVSRRDIQYHVINISNYAPAITHSGIPAWLCAGDQTCFDLYFSDRAFGAQGDSLRFDVFSDIPGYTIVNATNRPGYRDAGFCWTPQLDNVRNKPWLLQLRAYDNACPLNLYTYATYQLKVAKKQVVETRLNLDTCGYLDARAIPERDHANQAYHWYLLSESNNVLAQHSGKQVRFKLESGGNVKVRLEMTDGLTGCGSIQLDSLEVPNFQRPVLGSKLPAGGLSRK
jgi:hypothetical protein